MINEYDFGARSYDPAIARWYVQDPAEQFYNPYLAIGNNPVVLYDPDGRFIPFAVGLAMVLGGTINTVMNAGNINNPWQMFGYFAVGAAAGGLGAGVGAGVSAALVQGGSFAAGFAGTAATTATGIKAGFLSGAAGGFAGGFVGGAGNAIMQKQSFGDVMNSAFKGAALGAGTGALIGGVIGGIDALNHDLNFWTGADKQTGVAFKINSNGKVKEFANSTEAKEVTADHFKTDLNNCNNCSSTKVTEEGFYRTQINNPKGSIKITDVRGSSENPLISHSIVRSNKCISFETLHPIDKVTLIGARWHSTPINSIGDLFHWRKIR
jgi:hypothetical protein